MAGFIDNTIEVQAVTTLGTTPWGLNRYFYQTASAVDQVLADDIAAHFEALHQLYVAPRTRNNVALDYIRVKDNSQAGMPWFLSQIDSRNTSTGGALLPLQTTLCISLQSNVGGIVGRTFLFGYDHNQLDAASGKPASGVAGDAINYVNGIRDATANLGQATMIVIRNTGSPSVPVWVGSPVAGATRSASSAAEGWQVQRRRRDGLPV